MNVLDGIHFALTGADNIFEHLILSGITPGNLNNVSIIPGSSLKRLEEVYIQYLSEISFYVKLANSI